MGLVQREIEAAGFTTLTLSNVPDLTGAVSAPRVAGIEYPLGRPFGEPGDHEGQMAVLRATLNGLEEIKEPGGVIHLPFEWDPQPGHRKARRHEPPPITRYLRRKPWLFPRLLARQVPK